MKSRTYEWENPLDSLEKAKHLTGMEYMEAIFNGEIAPPPILATAGIEMVSVTKGNVVFKLNPQEFQYNPIGSVHGGIITTILDSSIGCSIHSLLPQYTGYTTLDIKINFLRKITEETEPLLTHTKVIHAGKSTALIESDLIDSNQKVYAHAVSTCMIFNPKP